jgi:hypothetical protein
MKRLIPFLLMLFPRLQCQARQCLKAKWRRQRERCEKPIGGDEEIDAGGWAKSVVRSRDPGDNTLVAKP